MDSPLLEPVKASGTKRWWKRRLDRRWAAIRDGLHEPTHRNLVIMAVLIGVASGIISLAYAYSLTLLLDFTWGTVPEQLLLPGLKRAHALWKWFPQPTNVAWVYIVLVACVFGGLAGVVQRVVGDPGSIPSTLRSVHKHGKIPVKTAPAMYLCSTFSIVSGASVGPEAPVLSVCGAAISWFCEVCLGQTGPMLRSSTLMGMAAGLSSLFGVSLGGAIFAFEVLHVNGLQYYETLPYGVFASIICLGVHRGLWNLEPFGAIWKFEQELPEADSRHIGVGVVLGLLGILLCIIFQRIFACTKWLWARLGLVEAARPIASGFFGGLFLGGVGVLLPATMFWSEFEFGTLADDSVPLAHVWPSGGVWGLTAFRHDKYSIGLWFALGFTKLVTISASVVSGLRGGIIFPLMFAGACIGQGLAAIPGVPWWSALPSSLPAIALGGALTSGTTRSPFACALILTMLSGIPQVMAPTLVACLVTFFGTMGMPFFGTQRNRPDIVSVDYVDSDDEEEDVESLRGSDNTKSDDYNAPSPDPSDSVQSLV